MLSRALAGVLTAGERAALFSSFDQIGGIIVVRVPEELAGRGAAIGRALLDAVKPARSVYRQATDVRGDYRTRGLELLAGEDCTVTEYVENGCRMAVDVARVFFTPRLSAERLRIAELAGDGETIVNMFGGVGAFSLAAARRSRCTVYSIDSNPEAARLCGINAERNKTKGTVISICGDAAEVVRARLRGASDRTLMPLPEDSDRFLGAAAEATRGGGTIHYYSHVGAPSKGAARKLSELHYAEVGPAGSEILFSRTVRAVGPRYYQTVVDARTAPPGGGPAAPYASSATTDERAGRVVAIE